jgi:hypothetical protein
MNKKEQIVFSKVSDHLPTATKVEYHGDTNTLYVFFKTGRNEFDITETKSVRMLRVYTLMGGERFDAFLEEMETFHKLLSFDDTAQNMDIVFLFV